MKIEVGQSSGSRNISTIADEAAGFYAVADSTAVERFGAGVETEENRSNGKFIERVYASAKQALSVASKAVKENKDIGLEELVRRIRSRVSIGLTTFTAGTLREKDGSYEMSVVSVGDSKAGILRKGRIEQVTEDQVFEDGKVKAGIGPLYTEEIETGAKKVSVDKGETVVIASKNVDFYDRSTSRAVRTKNPKEAAKALVENAGGDAAAVVIDVGVTRRDYSVAKVAAIALGIVAAAGAALFGYHSLKSTKTIAQPAPIVESMKTDHMSYAALQTEWPLVCTADDTQAMLFLASLSGEGKSEMPEGSFHTVKKGENLWNIVKEHYGLKDDKEIARKVNEIVGLNKGKYPGIAADTLFVDGNGRLRKGKDGIAGDDIKPGQEISLAQKTASAGETRLAYSLDRMIADYSNATFQDPAEMKADMSRFNEHVSEIARYYNQHGDRSALGTFSMLGDDPLALKDALNYARKELGMKVRASAGMLSTEELREIKDIYMANTNAMALKIIKDKMNLEMNPTAMYSALDVLGNMDGVKYRKRS